MRNFFQKIPFIRITSLFLIGILLSHFLKIELHLAAIFITILISMSILLWRNGNFTSIKAQNFLISITIIFSGLFYPTVKPQNNHPNFNQKEYFLAEVCQKPAPKAKTYQTILKIQNTIHPKPERVIAYISKARFDSTISIGDQLILLAKPQRIKNMGNPFEFDYQAMMQRKEIWFSVYLSTGTYLKTGHKVFRISYLAERLRDKLISKLAATSLKNQELAVVEALTLGYRSELDPETIDYFASTGAMHVLAVSGLHVGLIYFILGFLLSGIKRTKTGQIIFPAVMIICLWIYALITGFSPSVQRATVMFTFIILGSILRRPVNIFNTLTASALVLILIDPEVILEVGFQLSYLAVFGIVLVQPVFSGLVKIENRILRFLWTLFTVSVAAQLATFPLGLFYFNQFPNYFWLSNFFVIPGATIIIWLTFAFFIATPIPFFSALIAKLLNLTTGLMLEVLKMVSELPYAVNEGIFIKKPEVFIIYGILISILIFGFSKRKLGLFAAMFLIICVQASHLTTKYQLLNQKKVFAYNSPELLIHLINGRTNYLITNDSDSLSPTGKNIVLKVIRNLKLDEPVILNRQSSGELNFDDLKGSPGTFQFLNCRFNFKTLSSISSQHTELYTLELKSNIQDTIASRKTIFSGNSYFTNNKDTTNFHLTKLKGAYSLSLN